MCFSSAHVVMEGFTRAISVVRLMTGQDLQVLSRCGLLILLLSSTAFADEPQKNVLLFNSDDTSIPANVLVESAIRSILKEPCKSSLQIYDEGTDSFRILNGKYEAELVALLKRKYEGIHLDLIFEIGPPALRFLYLIVSADRTGKAYINAELVPLLLSSSRAPIYGTPTCGA
jgi:hypothetical protein